MAGIDALLRDLAPQVLVAVVRHHGDFDACEDAVQEALLAAARQWPANGVPDNPKAWLITVASRRRTEQWRSDTARRRREDAVFRQAPPEPDPASGVDESLTLLMLCCHPSLTTASQVALTLRAVGGLSTAEIARAFLVPESTVTQRISRAESARRVGGSIRERCPGGCIARRSRRRSRCWIGGGDNAARCLPGRREPSPSLAGRSEQRIGAGDARFRMPPPEQRPGRAAAVRQVLYLIFNEGHTASSGADLQRVELSAEAIRLTRQLHAQLPDDGEVAGLLALMLLTDARRPARTGSGGELVALAEQDRSRWDTAAIAEGTALVTDALAEKVVGPYQLQAAIAAVHDEAAHPEDTDWPQILALYDHLSALAPGPMVALNRVVAVAMVHGPADALAQLGAVQQDPALAGHHRVEAVRAHLLDMAGRPEAAREAYRRAAELTLSVQEQRYLLTHATG